MRRLKNYRKDVVSTAVVRLTRDSNLLHSSVSIILQMPSFQHSAINLSAINLSHSACSLKLSLSFLFSQTTDDHYSIVLFSSNMLYRAELNHTTPT